MPRAGAHGRAALRTALPAAAIGGARANEPDPASHSRTPTAATSPRHSLRRGLRRKPLRHLPAGLLVCRRQRLLLLGQAAMHQVHNRDDLWPRRDGALRLRRLCARAQAAVRVTRPRRAARARLACESPCGASAGAAGASRSRAALKTACSLPCSLQHQQARPPRARRAADTITPAIKHTDLHIRVLGPPPHWQPTGQCAELLPRGALHPPPPHSRPRAWPRAAVGRCGRFSAPGFARPLQRLKPPRQTRSKCSAPSLSPARRLHAPNNARPTDRPLCFARSVSARMASSQPLAARLHHLTRHWHSRSIRVASSRAAAPRAQRATTGPSRTHPTNIRHKAPHKPYCSHSVCENFALWRLDRCGTPEPYCQVRSPPCFETRRVPHPSGRGRAASAAGWPRAAVERICCITTQPPPCGAPSLTGVRPPARRHASRARLTGRVCNYQCDTLW